MNREVLQNPRLGDLRCRACNTAVFRSATKYESGTGWPSFWAPIAPENIWTATDVSYGQMREEVLCPAATRTSGTSFQTVRSLQASAIA
jgi:peptide-methionine (R)-S-oxide reductase